MHPLKPSIDPLKTIPAKTNAELLLNRRLSDIERNNTILTRMVQDLQRDKKRKEDELVAYKKKMIGEMERLRTAINRIITRH